MMTRTEICRRLHDMVDELHDKIASRRGGWSQLPFGEGCRRSLRHLADGNQAADRRREAVTSRIHF
jgi:hypothetical protein